MRTKETDACGKEKSEKDEKQNRIGCLEAVL